ncbi:MAG TPA: hypothetical protein VL120_08880 [Solirubrobacteraceae bacterium]|jgi:hypothetical protein|nr:hypothetical protein [Solirubrobacteraceae bacterium]
MTRSGAAGSADDRLEHYRASLGMLQGIVPQHPLVERLAHELDEPACVTA